MAKKKSKDLIIVPIPDLFEGIDLYGAGASELASLFDIDTTPDTDVAVSTEELADLFTSIMSPIPTSDQVVSVEVLEAEPEEEVSLGSIFDSVAAPAMAAAAPTLEMAGGEVSLDEVFDMYQGLLQGGFVEPGAVVKVAAETPAMELPPVWKEPVAVPLWHETEAIFRDIDQTDRAVILQRIGNRAIAVVPRDLMTAAMLKSYAANGFDKLGFVYKADELDAGLQPIMMDGEPKDCRLHFPLKSLLTNPFVENSLLWKHLEDLGLKPFCGPSLRNWAMKAVARAEREKTPFNLPVIVDKRPMYDRMEVGLVVKCKEDRAPFKKDLQYVVVETDVIDEEAGDDDTKTAKGVGLKERGKDGGKPVYWNEIDGDMSEFFETDDASGAFDPANTFANVYPELYNAAKKRIDKQNLPVFDFVKDDVAELVNYRHVVFTDPPRMGKTSKIVQYAEAAGVKNAALVTVPNGLDVFASELERMGIKDYVVVKKLSDLDKPVKYFLLSYNWLKSTGRQALKDDSPFLGSVNQCPHCKSTLMRPSRLQVKGSDNKIVLDAKGLPILRFEYEVTMSKKVLKWTDKGGYACRNAACTYSSNTKDPNIIVTKKGEKVSVKPEKSGAAWRVKNHKLTAYIDIPLARHALCVDQKTDNFNGGRRCQTCGYVHRTWMPARYKRVGKRFSMIGVDEVHNVKNPSTEQSKAIMGLMKARRRVSMTGTLMPNHPQDAFNPLAWTFGTNNEKFPFSRGTAGVEQFNAEYTEKIIVESENSSYAKPVPFIKKPRQWWEWKASKTHFRAYSDPRVIAGMLKAGLVIPTFKTIPVELLPGPKQGLTLVASIDQFNKIFDEYNADLKAKAKQNEKVYLLNSSQILSRMNLMRYAATIPGLLNDKLAAIGKPSVYDGPYGGVKMEHVKTLVKQKTDAGGKVVIFSDMRPMQALLETELVYHNPIRFQVSWNAEKRAKMFKLFREDPDYKVLICGPRAVKESIDLSSADTVISTDLLWSPGIQTQAWARVLTPRPYAREVECHILLTKYSIDSHVYGTFYSKVAAAEQALYGRTLTKADKSFDVKYFVDQILSEKTAIMQWLIESGEEDMAFMPVLQTLQQLTSYGEEVAVA